MAHPIDFTQYPNQELTSVSYNAAVISWANLLNRDTAIPALREVWHTQGRDFVMRWQRQSGALCGLHALNALHNGDLDNNQPDPDFPFYTKAMLDAAKEHVEKVHKNDWNGLQHDNDYTDPPTLMILARNRGDFLVQVDMHDEFGVQYLNGLYPLPDNGKWILSYPGHHISVWRLGEEFCILDSLNDHIVTLNSQEEYVRYVQTNFGQIYTYLIYYSDAQAKGEFAPVAQVDKDRWAVGDHVWHATWGDFHDERVQASAGHILNIGGIFDQHIVETLQDFLPLPNPAAAPGGWYDPRFDLVGLSVPSDVGAEALLKRRKYLQEYLTALENATGVSAVYDSEIRRLTTEGRILLTPERFLKAHAVPDEKRSFYRRDWLIVLRYLMSVWAKQKIESIFDEILLPNGGYPGVSITVNGVATTAVSAGLAELIGKWKGKLMESWDLVIRREMAHWLQGDFEYLPLTEEFYYELLDLVEWDKNNPDQFIPAIPVYQKDNRIKMVKEVALRWLPKESEGRVRRVLGITSTWTDEVNNLRANGAGDLVLSSQTLLKEGPGFTPADLYGYLDKLVVLETNKTWNPYEIISTLDRDLAEEEKLAKKEFPEKYGDHGASKRSWERVFFSRLLYETFSAPNELATHFDGALANLQADKWRAYEVARNNFLQKVKSHSAEDLCKELSRGVQLPFFAFLPIYNNDIATLANVKDQVEYFRSQVGFTSRRDRWEDVLARAFKLPEWRRQLKLDSGRENPIPYQVYLDPDALERTIKVVNTEGSDVKAVFEQLLAASGCEPVAAPIWAKVEQIRATSGFTLSEIVTSVLQGYRKRRLSFREGFDGGQLSRILALEEMDAVEADLRKYKPVRLNQTEEVVLVPGTLGRGKIRGSVTLVATSNRGLLLEDPERLCKYRWRFEHASRRGTLIQEWFEGPTEKMTSTVELDASIGSGVLSCEAHIFYAPGGSKVRPQYVDKVTCPNSLVLRVLHTCVRCGKNYNKAENSHGACRFHPPPNPSQAFIMNQANTPHAERNWSYFLAMLDSYWEPLPDLAKNAFLDETYGRLKSYLPERHQHTEVSFDNFFENIESVPFSVLLKVLMEFPWRLAVETKYGRISPYVAVPGLQNPPYTILQPPNTSVDESKILPKNIREWLADLPLCYVQRVHAKWCEFQGTRKQLERRQNFGMVQKLPENYRDLITVARDIFNRDFSAYEQRTFFSRMVNAYTASGDPFERTPSTRPLPEFDLTQENDLSDWRDTLLRNTVGMDPATLKLLLNHFPWPSVFGERQLVLIRAQIRQLIEKAEYVDPMDEESPDPAKLQLVRIAPANILVDDVSSVKFGIMTKNGGVDYKTAPNNWSNGYLPEPLQNGQVQNTVQTHYGYDACVGKWQCCGQRDPEAPGCWMDFHSEKMPYVRFIGHKENYDARGSWPVVGAGEFRHLWREIERSVFGGNLQRAQDLVMQYFGMQCRLSGYNSGETVYWPVAKEKDHCTPHFAKSPKPTATDPSIPKRGFAEWEKQIPLLDLLEKIVEIRRKDGTVPKALDLLVNTIEAFKIGKLPSIPTPVPMVTVVVPPSKYAAVPNLPLGEDDGTFDGPILAMPILTLALWRLYEIVFVDTMPVRSLSLRASIQRDVPLVV